MRCDQGDEKGEIPDRSPDCDAAAPKKLEPINVYVGWRIKLRRMACGLYQNDIAKALGLTYQQIQKYEWGENGLSVRRLYALSELLDVPVAYFFGGFLGGGTVSSILKNGGDEEGAGKGTRLEDFMISPEGVKLCAAFLAIERASTRARAMELIESLATRADIQAASGATNKQGMGE